MTNALPILVIGDLNREEFRDAAAWVLEQSPTVVRNLKEAFAALREGLSPAVIVIAQALPGQFSATDIDQLRRAAPVARIIGLHGSWLEGELRTGKPWSAAIRIYWHQWAARFRREQEQLDSGESSWQLPVTANDDERVLALRSGADYVDEDSVLIPQIAIFAASRETAETLIDLCAQRGWNTIWIRSVASVPRLNFDCALFDAAGATVAELEMMAAFKAALGEIPLVALLGFPRVDDVERFKRSGASAVVSKPYLADDLFWQLEQLMPELALR